MNIRCAFCQTPYTLSRIEMIDALQEMDAKKLNHYDAHCPRCRRATSIPRQRMEMFMPKWRDELREFEAEIREHPQQAAPAPASVPAPVPEEAPKSAPKTETPSPRRRKAAVKPAADATPKPKAEKKPAVKQTPAVTLPSTGKKATTKKSK